MEILVLIIAFIVGRFIGMVIMDLIERYYR
jgi:uncharacterized membrane-anchored protein YhcB (DUF1043 family)